MNAIAMQVVDTTALSVKRQIKAKKAEIAGYEKLIRQREEWLAVLENRDKSNYRSVVNSRDMLKTDLEEAKYELYKLERL